MKLLHLHPGPDTGGQSVAAKRVFEEAGDEVRVIVHRQHPFGYGEAELWDIEEVDDAYRWADVVVVHNDAAILDRIENRPERHVIVHHHGSRFRHDPAEVWRQGTERNVALQVVSTIDLLGSVPAGQTAEWMPQVVDTRKMVALAEVLRPLPDARVVVTHAPTNRMIKGTRWVSQTMRNLRRECDYVLISKRPWVICLTLKASSHIFIDQLLLGYGNNAIEAWAMGLPVVAGADARILARMRQEFGGSLPFVEANPDTLTDVVRSLVEDPAIRAEWGAIGRAHVERFHVPEAWIARTRSLYSGSVLTTAA